jgi:integrase
MTIKVLHGADGTPLAVRAFAGKVKGKKIVRRFALAKFDGSLRKAEAAAYRWASAKATEIKQHRSSVIAIPDTIRSQIIEAIELLEPYGISIIEAVRGYIKLAELAPPQAPWTFGQAATAFLESRALAKRRPDYLESAKNLLRVISKKFGDQLCDAITTEEIEQWFAQKNSAFIRAQNNLHARRTKLINKRRADGQLRPGEEFTLRPRRGRELSAWTYRAYRRHMSLVFKFAIDRGRARHNPAKKVLLPEVGDEPVRILTTAETKRLLEAAEAPIMTYLIIGLFAGLRPNEALRLTSSDIDMQGGYLHVTGAKAKSRTRRLVTMSENTKAWMAPLVPLFNRRPSPGQRRGFLRRAAERARIVLSRDVLRHTFASHHLALHRNANLTEAELGHSSGEMLFRHYREIVKPAEAAAFAALKPRDCLFYDESVAALYGSADGAQSRTRA